MPLQELIIALGRGFSHPSHGSLTETSPARGEISALGAEVVADLLHYRRGSSFGGSPAKWGRLVCHGARSGTSSDRPPAASLVIPSTISLPWALLCAGTQQAQIWLFLAMTRPATSLMALTTASLDLANRLGLVASRPGSRRILCISSSPALCPPAPSLLGRWRYTCMVWQWNVAIARFVM